ncbi:hypothetical protein CVT24_009084 [Panaeolus cyanescens]|uniref:TFIIS N-terminal domain-containing protein n=1 Tax=Panaeolus cyanescens TaxID=181874 RepID=A0A409VAN4_9AGAR|nr:hypothetical protein CVT24_009084 [Panaeolus cyanescens]
MDSNLYSQWVSQTPEPGQQHHQPHQLAAQPSEHIANIDNWHKEQPQSSSSTLPISTTPIDSLDFAPLSDPTGQGNPTYFTNQYAYFMQPSPYTTATMAYPAPWNNPSTSVPVSKYSSLNGATTSPPISQTSPQTQPQQQSLQQHSPTLHTLTPHPSTTNAMIIDPILSMNGAPSNGFSHSTAQAFASQSQGQAQQQAQSSQPIQQRPQFYSPMIAFQSPYYRPHLQQPSQGTLSPQALHSPTTQQQFMTISPNAFYSHGQIPTQPVSNSSSPPPPSAASTSQVMLPQQPPAQDSSSSQPVVATSTGPTKEQLEKKREQLRNSVRPYLQALTGAGSVTKLVDRLSDYGYSDVDCELRMEILGVIRDGAGNPYYRAWSENATAMEITREWLRAASKADKSDKLSETTMPLLHLIDRLPLTLEGLIQSKLAKVIKKLAHTQDPTVLAAAKDMAFNLEQRWRGLINEVKDPANTAPSSNGGEDKAKKRKLSESGASKVPPPSKKAALGSASSSKPVVVKKETKPSSVAASSSASSSSSATAKDAKADSSFFSAPKAKAKLPSFTKKPVVVKKEEAAPGVPSNVAMPSSIDPFQEALKAMKTRKESPAVSTPPAVGNAATANTEGTSFGLTKTGKKKKSVTWAPEGQLESIRFIEKALYDDDHVDGTHLSLRDLDRGEGAALHAPLFEETIDWAEPLLLELPIDLEVKPRGTESEEKEVQERREQTALGALYMNASQIPDSPGEPPSVISDEELDKGITTMIVGELADAAFNGDMLPPPPPPPPPIAIHGLSVTDLVNQLAMTGQIPMNMMDTGMAPPHQEAFPFGDPNQLQNLLQNLQNITAAGILPNGAPPGGYGHPGGGYDEGNQWGHGIEDGVEDEDEDADEEEKTVIDTLKENLAVSLQQEGEHRTIFF